MVVTSQMQFGQRDIQTEDDATVKQIASLKTRQKSLSKAVLRLGHENSFLGVRAQSIVRTAYDRAQRQIAQLETKQSDLDRTLASLN